MIVKRNLNSLLTLAVLVAGLSACGWRPPCSSTALTAPWDKMNLPVQKDAAVCVSSTDKFQAAHKGEREQVTRIYLNALQKEGWRMTRRDPGATYNFDFERGSDHISLEIYDWEKTGVIIRKR
jgi:hypothetical protein